jgi:AbrB family looped-hinge helix DNA binding protein
MNQRPSWTTLLTYLLGFLPICRFDGFCPSAILPSGSMTFRISELTTNSTLMSTLVKVQHKGQVTIPTHLRTQAGIMEGDLVEATFHRGTIVLTPKMVIDRSQFAKADEEYTPAQRQIIDARLAKGLEDVKKGRTVGPFHTTGEMIASMNQKLKKRAAVKKRKLS